MRSILCSLSLLFLLPSLRAFDAAQPIGLDPLVVTGRLANGMTYFVRPNKKPENRVELRLAIRSGSVLEADDQRGLAHLLEHMAFNGSRDFKKQDLVKYLESIGMSFGADLNAFTSFDKTVYMLQVPAEQEKVAKAMQILENWASALLLEGKEIDQERAVVIEEWRLRRGADQRMMDQQFPILFHDSRYAQRLPIGTKEVLDTFTHDRVRAFYQDWYRPDLMSVSVVGDFPTDQLKAMVEERFGKIPAREKPVELPTFPVPDHEQTLYALAEDAEASSSSIGVMWKRDPLPSLTAADFRRGVLESLFTSMLNLRLDEIREKADAPFLRARAGGGRYIRTKEFYSLSAEVKENGHLPGFKALLTEVERVRRHGFTEGELKRTLANLHRSLKKAYQERETTPSSALVMGLVGYFTDETAFPSAERRLQLFEELQPDITLAEINQLANTLMPARNQVVVGDGPKKEGLVLPKQEELAAALEAAGKAEVAAYKDNAKDEPLLAKLPAPGSVRERKSFDPLGLTQLILSNGIQVWLKPTDFKKDEVLLSAFSPGGLSLVSVPDLIPGETASTLVDQSGVGVFNRVQLRNRLSGKVVSLSPFVGELQEGLSGGCSPEDMQTLFELIHLTFTAPRLDTETFQTLQRDMRESLVNRWSEPESWMSDRMAEVLSGHHPRHRPPRLDDPDRMNAERSLALFRERFADADDFTFLLVGNVDVEEVAKLAAQYLATLPVREGAESWKDPRVKKPAGEQRHVVEKGVDPKAQVSMIYHGPMTWDYRNRHRLQSLLQVLNIRLRESIREDKGGVYSIRAGPSFDQYPRPEYQVQIGFGCDPARATELISAVKAEIERLKKKPITAAELAQVQETQRRKRETDLKTNSFWSSVLQFYLWNQEDPIQILKFEEMVSSLNAKELQQAAQTYFGANQAVFILRPQAK